MEFANTSFIQAVSSFDDDEGNCVDTIELTDGRVLAVDGEGVTLFENIQDVYDSVGYETWRPRIEL